MLFEVFWKVFLDKVFKNGLCKMDRPFEQFF